MKGYFPTTTIVAVIIIVTVIVVTTVRSAAIAAIIVSRSSAFSAIKYPFPTSRTTCIYSKPLINALQYSSI